MREEVILGLIVLIIETRSMKRREVTDADITTEVSLLLPHPQRVRVGRDQVSLRVAPVCQTVLAVRRTRPK